MIFGENRKKEQRRKNNANRAFAAAKGTFAVVNCFAAERPRAKNGHPRVRFSEAMLRRGEDTVHSGLKFYFVFESRVFVH